MSVLYIAIPVALVVALVSVVTFVFQVRGGQYDDLETPATRMLYDETDQLLPIKSKHFPNSR